MFSFQFPMRKSNENSKEVICGIKCEKPLLLYGEFVVEGI
jgi:hypothetical protein